MIYVKSRNVKLHLSIEMVNALLKIENVFRKIAKEMVITSANDSLHRVGSLHYKSNAIDLRTRHLTTSQLHQVMVWLRQDLGTSFDVLYEGDHIHIEYDNAPNPELLRP